jgi:hypothetical protein
LVVVVDLVGLTVLVIVILLVRHLVHWLEKVVERMDPVVVEVEEEEIILLAVLVINLDNQDFLETMDMDIHRVVV